ncbi:MAG: glycoside hydrolase family 28 protein [Firmicutes bacterium]|nr:glycoside hydrolase family 28 protein [Bacillota bacterium]
MADFTTVFDVRAFGARPDGQTPSTAAITAAIEACAAAGGGVVYIPAGRFFTGPLRLKSHVRLHLEAGAHLLFSQDPADYPVLETRWEGKEVLTYAPQIYGEDLEGVAVTGRGTLDGRGETWWRLFRAKALAHPRPRLMAFTRCKDVLIEGVRLVDSPAWTINPVMCERVTIAKVTIINPPDSPNTDGIDPDSCRNVYITNCYLDVGDDCIAIKAGREDSPYRTPCENIVIADCLMLHGHGGVVLGSETSGGIRNVAIANCIFEGTDRGIRLKSRRGRGGFVEDLRATNIIMEKVVCPFVLNMYYDTGGGAIDESAHDLEPHPVTEATPVFRRIHFSNITAREVGAAAAFLYGLPERPLEDVSFDNVWIEMAENALPARPAMMRAIAPMARAGILCYGARRIAFRHVQVSGHQGPAFKIERSEGVRLVGCSSDGSDGPQVVLARAEGVAIRDCEMDY